MAAFGENLQREREMRGVSLEEISAATKISVRFLQAIEDEDFGSLPGGVFTRSFIRTYARYLGLDEERVMAELQLSGQPETDVDMQRLAALKQPIQRPGSPTTLLVLLVAGLMLSAAYLLYRYSRHRSEVQATSSSAQTNAASPSSPSSTGGSPASGATANGPGASTPENSSNPAAAAGSTPSSSGVVETANPAGQTAGSGSAAPIQGAVKSTSGNKPSGVSSGLMLQVAATESAWVGIEADGQTVLQRVMQPNEVKTLKARESFDVTTGNAQGVILTLNGETLKPLGHRGEVKSVHLTHDDVKNPAP